MKVSVYRVCVCVCVRVTHIRPYCMIMTGVWHFLSSTFIVSYCFLADELTSDKPVDQLSQDQAQIVGMMSDEGILSQRTLSQSSSLSDSTPEGSALSPDIQTTLAQLNTSNLDIATRRNILLGRTKNKYVCEVCGRECPSKHKLKRHLSTHSEERPFSCQICGKSFKWTEYLQKHMRQQHHGGAEG